MKHEFDDDGDSKIYFTMLPNLLCHLGLTPYEFALYSHMKRAAGSGNQGVCTKSTRTLSKECRMSPTIVVKAKAALAKKRPELNNKALIRITKRANPNGGKDYDQVTITDIWRQNTERFAPQEQVLDMELEARNQVPRDGRASTTNTVKQVLDMEHKKNVLKEKRSKEYIGAAAPETEFDFETWKDTPEGIATRNELRDPRFTTLLELTREQEAT